MQTIENIGPERRLIDNSPSGKAALGIAVAAFVNQFLLDTACRIELALTT
jgi:hypothetical protein